MQVIQSKETQLQVPRNFVSHFIIASLRHFRRLLTTKRTLYHFPRPDPLAKITPMQYSRSYSQGYQMVPTQSNTLPLSTSPATGTDLSMHPIKHKKLSYQDSHLTYRHKKYFSGSKCHTHHQNEVSQAHYYDKALDEHDHNHEKLPSYAAQFPQHSNVKNISSLHHL